MAAVRKEPPRYLSFMLRCWEARGQQPDRLATWRFSLQDAETGERHAFRDLTALVAYLERELACRPSAPR
jgi:hypothetical protein